MAAPEQRDPAQRVVVTGAGALSSLGCSLKAIEGSLRGGTSGIVEMPAWKELGLRSQIGGDVVGRDDYAAAVEASRFSTRQLEVMGPVAALCALATEQALAQARLANEDEALVRREDFGCLVGSGVSSMQSIYDGAHLAYSGKARRVRPFAILQGMSSTVSAHLVRFFGFGGRSYSISSACSTSSHSIGHAYELIRGGRLRAAVAGGGDEVGNITAAAFNALRAALSSGFNDRPHQASRPFDQDRDGFVLSGGAGVLVLESLESARERGARPLVEISGFAANSDDHDMVLPEPTGRAAGRCMRAAIHDAGRTADAIDYVNAHGTGTPAGDTAELSAIREVFGGDGRPAFSSTKSLGGHALGAAGALEAIHCMLMMRGGFLAASANVETPEPAASGLDLVTSTREVETRVHLSNSFGFGGTNASVVFEATDTD